jgi:hypothetical protein
MATAITLAIRVLRALLSSALAILIVARTAHGQTPPPLDVGSDGSDGAFVFVPDVPPNGGTMTIDLAFAASGLDGQGQPITWQTPSPVPGRGVYDSNVWAVVFKYTDVTVPVGKTVVFRNHAARAPVVWLVQGTATIVGTVNLDGGASATYTTWAEPGPGGFRGSLQFCAGFGPGGGLAQNGAGNYSVAGTSSPTGSAYGSPNVFPLIGGSGGASGTNGVANGWGGSGGGALLLAANVRIDISGSILARSTDPDGGLAGAWQRGSGGGVRLVADVISKSAAGSIQATGGHAGRIRMEANTLEGPYQTNVSPAPSVAAPGPLLPDSSTATVRVTAISIGAQSVPVPSDPRSSFSPPQADAILGASGPATLQLEAHNVPLGRTCTVRIANAFGTATLYTSTPLAGTVALSAATADVTLPQGLYAVQVRVDL